MHTSKHKSTMSLHIQNTVVAAMKYILYAGVVKVFLIEMLNLYMLLVR